MSQQGIVLQFVSSSCPNFLGDGLWPMSWNKPFPPLCCFCQREFSQQQWKQNKNLIYCCSYCLLSKATVKPSLWNIILIKPLLLSMLFLLWYEIYNYAFLFILTARNLRQIQSNSRNNVGHNGSAYYSVASLVLIPVFTKVLHNKSTSHLKSFVQYERLLAIQLHNSTSGEDRNLSIMKRAPGLSISHTCPSPCLIRFIFQIRIYSWRAGGISEDLPG